VKMYVGEKAEGKEEAAARMTGKGAEEEQKKSEEMAPPSVASVVAKEDKGGVFSNRFFCLSYSINRINLELFKNLFKF